MLKKLLYTFIIFIVFNLFSCTMEMEMEKENENFIESTSSFQKNDINVVNTDIVELDYTNAGQITVEYFEYDMMTEDDIVEYTEIVFNKNIAKIDGNGADFSNGVLTIKNSGAYLISGTLDDGKIIVKAIGEKVQLILDDLSLTCTTDAPLIIQAADKISIISKTGTKNYI